MAVAALASTATLCAAAVAAVGGDDGRVPMASAATAGWYDPDEHPVVAAKRVAASEEIRLSSPSDDLSWPLHGEVTGRFGEWRGGHSHEGIDIPMPADTPIKAASAGRVVMRKLEDGYGKYTCVAHTSVTTCYGHQSRFATELGATVERGQVIGYVGNTGNSGVTHLHFEVRRGTRPWGESVNPLEFLPSAG